MNTGKFYTNYSFEYPNENVRVATSSFQDVPSNEKPLINLTMNGILRPSEKLHVIKMKFEGDVPQKDTLAQSYGTFVLCKDVYNARKVIKTLWDKETDTLTITIDLRKYNVRPKRQAQFSFSVQINDCLGNPLCCGPCDVKKWATNCGAGAIFTCTNTTGFKNKWKVVSAKQTGFRCKAKMVVKTYPNYGNTCDVTYSNCPCFNNKGQVQNYVCGNCKV